MKKIGSVEIECIVVGSLEVNCYVLARSGECFIIDPGADEDRIKTCIKAHALTLKGILFTHGHADHIGAGMHFDAPLYIHDADRACLFDAQVNLSAFIGEPFEYPHSSMVHCIADGEEFKLGDVRLHALYTPGHTAGGVSFVCEGVVFSGDALFASSVGRSDFPGGDHAVLIRAIKEKLLTLPDDTAVYPGHGPESTIGAEKNGNPYLND
jgi:hydroxyacylglutathione hydrolase